MPARVHRVEDVVQRSRFLTTIARAAVPADARVFIAGVEREFPDATHHCWAFVAGPPGSTAGVGMSDAGEPKGTAGRPMLTVELVGGVFAGSAAWWIILCAGAFALRRHFDFRKLVLVNRATGVFVIAVGLVYLFVNMGNASDTPIVGQANLGANRTATNMEFPYAAPGDFRADGFPMPPNSLDQVQLLVRSAGAPGTYSVAATGGKGSGAIKVSPAPTNATPQIS